jgi:excisionase family DNA binding protein
MKRGSYNELKYSIRILSNGDGTYSVEVPKIPGCYSAGKTKSECIANIVEAISFHLEGAEAVPQQDPIPGIEVVKAGPSVSDHLISLPEACKFLDISDATLRRYIRAGRVPAYNFGKEYKFKIDELSQFISTTRVTPKGSRTRKTG